MFYKKLIYFARTISILSHLFIKKPISSLLITYIVSYLLANFHMNKLKPLTVKCSLTHRTHIKKSILILSKYTVDT